MNWDQMVTLVGSIMGPLAGAVAAYYAIRQDLAVLRVRLDAHERAVEQISKRADVAHERIDDVLKGKI
jgi:hypothetical protein